MMSVTMTDRGLALASRPWSDRVLALLRFAQLAPSIHNSQPWKARVAGDVVDVLPDRSRATPVVDPEGRQLALSCGAFVFHLRTAAKHHGIAADVALLPAPGVYARLRLRDDDGDDDADSPCDDADLFSAIPLRRTSRQPFHRAAVAKDVVAALAAAAVEGARLVVVDADADRQALARLVTVGDRRQWSSPAFRAELAGLVPQPRRSAPRRLARLIRRRWRHRLARLADGGAHL